MTGHDLHSPAAYCERCNVLYGSGDPGDERAHAHRERRMAQLDAEGRPLCFAWGQQFAQARDDGMEQARDGQTPKERFRGLMLAVRAWHERDLGRMLDGKKPLPSFAEWAATFDVEREFRLPQHAAAVAEFRRLYPRRHPAA
jgi:hypothetical protein